MCANFYLFDVDHGQCAALEKPHGKWYLFDAGATDNFSPIQWISNRNRQRIKKVPLLAEFVTPPLFKFSRVTISHFHGDHLSDYSNLRPYLPRIIHTVRKMDNEYIRDAKNSNTAQSWPTVLEFIKRIKNQNLPLPPPLLPIKNKDGIIIRELSLPANVARALGGDANARVNNASVVTRIDIYLKSILICGDLMKEAWDAIIADKGSYGKKWRPLISNIDILVAPHHGHKTGYSEKLLKLARPKIVLISMVYKDTNIDSRYSNYGYFSTRQKGHIKITIPLVSMLGIDPDYAFGDAALE